MINYQKNLPDGWAGTNLGEIITLEYGKGLRADKRDQKGNVPVYGSNGIVGYHSTSLTKKPCLIIGRKGAAGSVHLSRTPCWAIDTTYFIERTPNNLDLNFLYHLLTTLNLNSFDKSTAIPGLNRDDVYAIRVAIPPLQEQHRIVSKLEELFTKLDAGIQALKKTKVQLKYYRQSILKYAFEGKLTEKWREIARSEFENSSILERIKEGKRKSTTNKTAEETLSIDTQALPELSDRWVWTSVGQLILDARYGTSRKCWYETNGIPVLRIPNIINGSISLQDLKYAPLSDSEKEALRLTHGDVIVIRTNGSLGLVGRSAVVTEIKDITAFASYLIRLRPIIPVLGTFINTYLRSKRARNFIERNARTTAGQHNINLRTLSSIPIPLPRSVSEQNKIIELIQFQFSIIDNTLKAVEDSFRYAERLRQSILMAAFAGKLVPQDLTDEPASILMKKIEESSKKDNKVKEKIRNKIDANQTMLI